MDCPRHCAGVSAVAKLVAVTKASRTVAENFILENCLVRKHLTKEHQMILNKESTCIEDLHSLLYVPQVTAILITGVSSTVSPTSWFSRWLESLKLPLSFTIHPMLEVLYGVLNRIWTCHRTMIIEHARHRVTGSCTMLYSYSSPFYKTSKWQKPRKPM